MNKVGPDSVNQSGQSSRPNTNHSDDVNKLSHLEDHSYSLGPKTESSADHNLEIVKPCTPEFKEQSMFPDCGRYPRRADKYGIRG